MTPSTPTGPLSSPKSPPSAATVDIALASLVDEPVLASPAEMERPFGKTQSERPVSRSAVGIVMTSERKLDSVSSRLSLAGGPKTDEDLSSPSPELKTIRRRRSTQSHLNGMNRRKLTVECSKRKLIDDYIDHAAHAEDSTERASCRSLRHPAQEIQTPGAVLSIWGSETIPSDRFVPFFAEKRLNFDGEFDTLRHRVGIMSHRGYKPESPNQDDFFVLARADSMLLGILDGHGPDGHDVSHFVQERLPMYITEHLRQDPDAWEEAVETSVRELCMKARDEIGEKAEFSGTTATVVYLDQPPGAVAGGPMRLRCAFLGDSIAVLAKRKTKSAPWEVTPLTDIHRPDRPDELERIKLAGGSVSFGKGKLPSRLQTPTWNLAMSRSLGDFHAMPYGLSNKPEFAPEKILEPDYEYMILACSDGIWDVIQAQQAVKFVGKFSPDEAQLAVERLVSKAQRRWQETEDCVDDITAVLVWPGFATDASSEDLD